MLTGVSEEKIEEIESRALEVWDRVYQAWMMNALEQKTTIGPKVTSSAVYQTWDHFLEAMQKTPGNSVRIKLFCLHSGSLCIKYTGVFHLWILALLVLITTLNNALKSFLLQ